MAFSKEGTDILKKYGISDGESDGLRREPGQWSEAGSAILKKYGIDAGRVDIQRPNIAVPRSTGTRMKGYDEYGYKEGSMASPVYKQRKTKETMGTLSRFKSSMRDAPAALMKEPEAAKREREIARRTAGERENSAYWSTRGDAAASETARDDARWGITAGSYDPKDRTLFNEYVNRLNSLKNAPETVKPELADQDLNKDLEILNAAKGMPRAVTLTDGTVVQPDDVDDYIDLVNLQIQNESAEEPPAPRTITGSSSGLGIGALQNQMVPDSGSRPLSSLRNDPEYYMNSGNTDEVWDNGRLRLKTQEEMARDKAKADAFNTALKKAEGTDERLLKARQAQQTSLESLESEGNRREMLEKDLKQLYDGKGTGVSTILSDGTVVTDENREQWIRRISKELGPKAMQNAKDRLGLESRFYQEARQDTGSRKEEAPRYYAYQRVQEGLAETWAKGGTANDYYLEVKQEYDNVEASYKQALEEVDALRTEIMYMEQRAPFEYGLDAEIAAKKEELEKKKQWLEGRAGALQSMEYHMAYATQARYMDLKASPDYQQNVAAGREKWAGVEQSVLDRRNQEIAEAKAGNVEIAGLSDEDFNTEDWFSFTTPVDGHMTPEQEEIWYALYGSGREAEAYEYADQVIRANQAENEAAWEEEEKEKGGKNALTRLGSYAAGVLTFPFAIWDRMGQWTQYLNTGTIMPSRPYGHTAYQTAKAWSEGAAEKQNELYGTLPESWGFLSGKGVGDAMLLGQSVLESVGAAALGGGITNAMFYFSAAADGTEKALARGASEEKALAYGCVCGAAEVLGETLSVENLVHMDLSAPMLMNILRQSGIEASEEGFTDLLVELGDKLVNGDKSETDEKIKAYLAAGIDYDTAVRKAWTEWVSEVAFDVFGGAISGGASAGIHTGVGKVADAVGGLRQNAIAPLNPQADAQTAQEAAGEAQAPAQAETAPTPAEAPTEAPALLNSQAEASKPYTAVDALIGENPRAETATSPAAENRGFVKPQLSEVRTRAQEAVARMIGEARDQADMLGVMEQIIDEPTQVYAQAFYDLTGMEPEDYMARLSAPSASAYADYDITGVDFLIGDQYNPEHGQGIRPNSQLAIDAYAAQQQREKGYSGKSWYDDAVETAIVQIKEDGKNAGRIAGGQGEWAEFTPRQRAEILRQATGKEYYVSGNEVVKSKGRVESDTDNKNERFYEYDLKAAGVNDTPLSEDIESKKIYERESAEKEGKKFTDREEPPSYVGRMRQQYDEESLSEFGKSIRRVDAMNHRANMETWREKQYGGKLIVDPALGTPDSSLRSDQLQRIMRSEERLNNLIKGEGNFAKYGVDRRFDMLRAMYPDADWKIDAKTDQIIRPTEPVKNPSEPADVWHRDTTPNKKTIDTKKAKESAVLEGLQNKAKQSSSRPATGEGRIISRSELEARAKRAAVAANRGLGLSADQGGSGKGSEIGAGGVGQRNESGAPVLTKEQFPHWEAGLDHAEKLNAKLIGKTTKAMDEVSEHCRKMGVPCTHLDITALAKDLGAGTSTGGFSLGHGGVFIGWGKGLIRNGATDHEIIHFKAYEKYGAHEGAAPLVIEAAKVLDKSSVDGIKKVFRAIYENKYSKDRFLTTYDKLSDAQKLTIDKLINAEIFGDACANVYDKFRSAGLTVSQFTAFHNACLDAAVAADLITPEERAEMESFQKKPVRDDYVKELNAPKENGQAKAKPETPDAKPKEPKPRKPRTKKSDAIEALLKEYDRDQKLRDYETMRTAEEEENLGGINPVDVWNDDFDQEAYAPLEEETHAKEEASAEKEAPAEEKAASEKPKPKKKSPYTPNNEYNERMQQREDQREADEKSYQAEQGEPESSGEYRSKPQREARAELDKADQERLDQEKLDQEKAEKERSEFQAKQRWGEETHKELSKLADAIDFRVGNKRVGSSKLERYQANNGDIKYSGTFTVYETESERPGGRYLKPVADAVRGLVEGRNDARAVSDAYEYLNSKSQEKTGAYFYDEQLGTWLSEWAEDVEDAMKNPVHSSTKTDSLEVPALPAKLAQRGVELLTVMEHRIKTAQNSLSERAGFGDAFKTSQKVKDGIRGYADYLLKVVQRIQLRPTTAFKLIGGFNSETGHSFYTYADRVQKSTRNFLNIYQGAVDYIQDLTSNKGYNKFLNGKSQVKNVVPGLDYKGDTISANLAVGILKTLETSGAIDHIIRTGVVEVPRMEGDFYNDRNSKGFGDKKGYSKIFDPISAETRKMLSDAEASHDDYALDAATARAQREMDKLVKDLHKVIEADPVAKLAYEVSSKPMAYLARAMNKTSKTIWGIKVATQGNSYWPLLAANTFGGDRLLNSSHLGGMNGESIVQSRTGDAGGLKIMPFTATLDSYLQTAAHWAAFQELSDSLDINSKAFIGTESLSDVVNANLGKGWGTWLENYVKDLNGQARGEKAKSGWLGALRSNLVRSALTLNPGVALKQTPSFLNYLTFIDGDIIAKRFATGLLRTTKSFGADALINAVEEHTSMLKSRRTGLDVYGVDTEGGGKGVISRVTKALSKLGSSWITRMDVRTVSNGMLACADQVDRWIENGTLLGVKKGTAAYYKEIADLFERATIDTQPIYQKEYRPDMFRTSNEVIRTAAMFGTQPAQNYNNLVETWGEYTAAKKAGNTSASKTALRKVEGTVAGIITSSFLFAMYGAVNGLLKHKLKDVRDDDGKVDPEKVFGPNAFYTWMSTLAGTSWVGRLAAPFVIDMLTARSSNPSNLFYGAEDGVYGLINDAASALLNFNREPTLKKGKAAALTMASAFGIPAKNGYDLLNSIVMYAADAIGVNPKNQDDAIALLDGYFHAAPTTKGNNTASAAISMLGKGHEEAASAIMRSLDLDDKKVLTGIKTAFKDALASGKIDESDVRTLLGDVKFDPDAVDTLISDAVKKKAAVEAEKAAREEIAKIDDIDSDKVIDKLSEFNAENDKDSSGRMDYILGLGLSDEETDVLVRSYAGQDYARQYLTCYDALRDTGFSPTKANTIIQSINTDDNTTLKQAEFWEAYEKDKNSESYIEILWNAMGYTGKNTGTWADYKKSKAK